MLTIQSNLKIQDLETLSKTLIKPDIINFGLNKVGGGYTDKIADKVIAKLSKLDKDKAIVIINDITLQMADKLLEAGYKNIYLAFGSFNKDGIVSNDRTVYNIMKAVIENNIKEKLNAISLEEIFNMKIDGIIANPPYGTDGNKITETIINKVNYEEYINLLPLKDYTLETGKYIDFNKITTLPPHSFGDADILTHIAKILDKPNDTIKTEKDLGAAAFTIDKPMLKFMRANLKKEHYAFDNIKAFGKDCDVTKTFVYHHFDTGSAHTSGMPKIESDIPKNNYNLKNIDASKDGKLFGVDKAIRFNTCIEKENFVKFYKENRNFINRLIANQFIGIRNDSACWPKVDWTKATWTVEAVLKEIANYTDDEIKDVLSTMDKEYVIKNDDCIEELFGEWL